MTEHQQCEYKQVWKDDWLKTICAFANAQGGRLIVGCDDEGNAVGLKNADKLLEDLPNKVRDVLGVMVDVDLRSDGQTLKIGIEPYPNPISFRGEYYYRSGSTTQALKGAALERFLMRKRGVHWDGIPVPKVLVSDLSSTALEEFRNRATESKRMASSDLAVTDPVLIEKLKLTAGDYLKNAALLLFHPDPEKFVSGAFIKIGFFRSDSDLRFQDEVRGDLFTQVTKTMDLLLTKYTEATISYRGVQRVERYPVPEEALREALFNAVVHRDYSTAAPIQIRVYNDKIRIWNPGQLPADWTVDKLLGKHASHPFNPDVANAFFRAGMIEAWGRGIEKIVEACATAKVPPPKIECEQGDIWVEFPFMAPETPAEKTQRNGWVDGLVENQKKMLTLITTTPSISKRELAEQIGISTTAIDKNIKKLRQLGLLERVGSGKGGHWKIVEAAVKHQNDGLVDGLAGGLVENQKKMLTLIAATPSISKRELAEQIGISTTAIDKNIEALKAEGLLKRIGPAKGGHWEMLK